jgi:hypothetical protein
MDPDKVWLVDHRIGYRCQALMRVQRMKEKEDTDLEKAGGQAFPQARKWSAVEYLNRSPGDGGEDSQS